MYRRIIFLALLFIGCNVYAQPLSPSAAKELLPAFRNDDSTLFKSAVKDHTPDGTVLLQLASVTNAPQVFRYVLDHYPSIDADLAIQFALQYANKPILQAAMQKPVPLGEDAVNAVLAAAWKKNEEEQEPSLAVVKELLVSLSLPEESIADYLPLLIREPSAATRAAVASWLISRHQAFDYNDFPMLGNLPSDYKPVVDLLVQQLRDLPAGKPIRGFLSRRHALLFYAVQTNDLPALKELAEEAETLEFSVPGHHSLFSYAVERSGLPVIKYLLTRDVNPDYYHPESRRSVLGSLLTRRNQPALQAVMPYIKTTAIELEDGNTPAYFCTQSFYTLQADAANAPHRQFYLSALKALRHSGADFNQPNGRYRLPVHEIPNTLEDSLARSVALLVLEQTTDALSLMSYASQFTYTPSDLPVLRVLCQQMNDPGNLFYNSGLQKAGLFPMILQEAKHLPALRIFTILLRSASYNKDVQQVRWLLNDVPMAYLKRDATMNADSIRRVIVNTALAGDGENALYYFLSHEHEVNWASKSVMKALMAAGADLYQRRMPDQKRPIDLLLASASYQKQYANEILSGLLPNLQLQCDGADAWQQTSTGDMYRTSLIAYQEDKKWLQQLKNCITMDLSGSSVTPKPNRKVKITGVGMVALGTFPIESCVPVEAHKIAGNPARFVFDFSSGIEISAAAFYTGSAERKEAAALRAAIHVKGHSGVEKMTMAVTSAINIPASRLDTGNHAVPPMILVRNNGDQIIVNQQDVPSYLAKDMEQAFDRSKGPIQIVYQRNHEKNELQLEIFGRIHDTEYPDLVVPIDTDPVSRLRLYAEILRLQNQVRSNPGKTTTDQISRKQDEVLIHLLSEYALQRYYPKKVKEEYEQNLRQLADINRLMEPLGQFYLQYTVLDFNNIAQLKQTLQTLIDEPSLGEQQRRDYVALLKRLNEATQLSQLADTYAQLMNSELLQQAEKQLDDKKRIGLEVALYATGGHLIPDNKQ